MKDQDRRLLPPMAMLRSFAAAARNDNFTQAADDIGLTQGAVSRQIANLEEWAGHQLFDRNGRRVVLNPVGRAFYDEIMPALGRIRRATRAMIEPPMGRVIELATLPSFGMRWLAPRLPQLSARHPDLLINISARSEEFDFANEPFDAAIHVGAADWPDVVHTPLFQEHVVPVIAPSLIERHEIEKPDDLLRAPLLVQAKRQDAWQRWCALQGIPFKLGRPMASFAHFLMLAQAVVAGAGAALLPTFLIQPELAAGDLAIPFELPLVDERAYFLVCPEAHLANSSVGDLCDWLSETVANEITS